MSPLPSRPGLQASVQRERVQHVQGLSHLDLDYEPEAGYFLGAMFVSYTIGILTVLPVAMLVIFVLKASLAVTLVVALLQTLVTMLLMFRYSRIIWLHLDQVIDPR